MSLDARSIPSQSTDIVWKAVRKRWVLGLSVFVIVFAGIVFFTIGQTRTYRASATLQINPNPTSPLGNGVQAFVELGAGNYWSNREYYGTQYKIISGRAVAIDTVRQLGLNRDLRFLGNVPPGGKIRSSLQNVEVEVAATILISRIGVEPVKDSRLAVVTYDDADPSRAKRVLSALVEVYLSRNVEGVVSSTGAAGDWLRSQVSSLKQELESSELSLHDFKKEKRILSVSLDDQSNMLRDEMKQLSQALTTAQARREGLFSRSRELDKIDPSNPATLSATELLNDALLSQVRRDYITARANLAALQGEGKGDNHPDVVSAKATEETTKQALLSEIESVKGAVRSDLAAVTREAAGLSGLFEQAKQRALDLNILEIEYRRLERTKENNEKLYGLVLERSKESDLSAMMRFNNIKVAEEPATLAAPVRPRVPVNLAIGLILGLVFGVGATVTRELVDRRFRYPEEVETELGVPFLGLLPVLSVSTARASYYRKKRNTVADSADALRVPELVVHTAPQSTVAEAARSMRTSIVFTSPDNSIRRILVTSGSPGEGKTMVASTIAITFAQTGERVLLVDCDLRRSRLHRVFGRSNLNGVSTVLVNPKSLVESDLLTDIPNLYVLPAGPRVPNPAEVLQSVSFRRLLDDLSMRFDSVILDSPPVAAVTDAVILATNVDGTVFVVRAMRTMRELAKRSIRAIKEVNGSIAGCVLNSAEVGKRGYAYYRYYYKEGYGPTKDKDSPVTEANIA